MSGGTGLLFGVLVAETTAVEEPHFTAAGRLPRVQLFRTALGDLCTSLFSCVLLTILSGKNSTAAISELLIALPSGALRRGREEGSALEA